MVAEGAIGAAVDKIDEIKNDKELREKIGEITYKGIDIIKDVNIEPIFQPKKIKKKSKGNKDLNQRILELLKLTNRNILLDKKSKEE